MRPFLLVFLCLLLPGMALATNSSQQLQSLIEQKKYAKAILEGKEILEQQPANVRARFLTAYAYQMTAHTDKAAAMYQALIDENPSLPEPRNNLAMIYLARGDYDRASELLIAAINTHPSYATAYDNLSRVYRGIASEAYRRALSESSEPTEFRQDIELNAMTRLATLAVEPASEPVTIEVATATPPAPAKPQPTSIEAVNDETRLIENVRNWAQAWSGKDFDGYIDAYLPDYHSKFNTRQQWLEYRRSRILDRGEIRVEVSEFRVRLRGDNHASVDFRQAFDSPSYSDRVRKRLDFRRVGGEWKIAAERVLSVL